MSGAVGKVAVLKKGPMSKLANLAMIGAIPFTAGASLAPMLATNAGRIGAKKLATKVGQRIGDVKDAYQGAKLAQTTQGVTPALGNRSPMKNAWEALRGRQYTGTNQQWVPNNMPGYRSFNPNPGELGQKFVGSPEAWDEATGFQDWVKNPSNMPKNTGQKTLAEFTGEVGPTELAPSPQAMTGARNKFARELASNEATAMGHGTSTQTFDAISPKTSDPFTSEEISTLMGGGVGVTSGASQLSATNQANLAQQAEEARRLQERAAGAAMGTVGNTHMGGTASPTG